VAGVAAALKGMRPEREGAALTQWGDDVVAVAAAFAALDRTFDTGDFFTRCGGL
jgi:hypothetical protein